MQRQTRKLGWKPDFPDHRDQFFSAPRDVLQALPASYDLTVAKPLINFPIYDQGPIGSCTANALAAAVQFDRLNNKQRPDFVPSRLFLYYNSRQIEGDLAIDGGAYLRDGVKTLNQLGICPEADWPYVPTPPLTEGGLFPADSNPVLTPSDDAYRNAKNYIITSYQALQQTLAQLQGALVAGFPFVFGFSVYQSWYGPESTVIPLPSANDSQVGGHAVLAVGYDNATTLFKFRNSWGAGVGEAGYFYIPYSYITNPDLASDFWVINAVND